MNITIVLPIFSCNTAGECTLMKMPKKYFKASKRAYTHGKSNIPVLLQTKTANCRYHPSDLLD